MFHPVAKFCPVCGEANPRAFTKIRPAHMGRRWSCDGCGSEWWIYAEGDGVSCHASKSGPKRTSARPRTLADGEC